MENFFIINSKKDFLKLHVIVVFTVRICSTNYLKSAIYLTDILTQMIPKQKLEEKKKGNIFYYNYYYFFVPVHIDFLELNSIYIK